MANGIGVCVFSLLTFKFQQFFISSDILTAKIIESLADIFTNMRIYCGLAAAGTLLLLGIAASSDSVESHHSFSENAGNCRKEALGFGSGNEVERHVHQHTSQIAVGDSQGRCEGVTDRKSIFQAV